MALNEKLSFYEPVQTLREEIFHVYSNYNDEIYHRASLAYVFMQLKNFRNELNQINFRNRILKKNDKDTFEELHELMKIFEINVKSYNSNKFESVIHEKFDQGLGLIETFRNRFNLYFIELHLFDYTFHNYRYPIEENRRQEITDCLDDIKSTKEYIQNELNNDENRHFFKDLRDRLLEINELEIKLIDENKKLNEEIEDADKEITIESFIKSIKSDVKSLINYDDIAIQKKIGEGGEGIVYLSYQKSTQHVLSVKKLKNQLITKQYSEHFKRELGIVSNLDHFAILPFVGICTNPLCIITEFMSGDSLYNRLKSLDSPPLSPTKLTIIALGVAHAIKYLHAKKLLHRDIKSLNVLLNSDDFPKLCDFGLSRYTDEPNDNKPGGVGTVNWMAPEIIKGKVYTEKSDVYSYGILLWEMLTGNTPYSDMNTMKVRDEVAYNNMRPKIPPTCSPKLERLIKKCWENDPMKRPDFAQIIEYFENGEVGFAGSEPDQVKAYISQYEKITHDERYIDNSAFSAASMREICQELNRGERSAISKLNYVLQEAELASFVRNSDVMKHLVFCIEKCESSQLAILLTDTITLILKNDKFLEEFENEGGSSSFLGLFAKYGTTSMPKAIDILRFLVESQKFCLKADIINRISPFLLFTDLNYRLNSLKFINYIIDNKCFESPNSFNSIVRNMLANLFPEAMPEIIIESLELITKLVSFAELNSSILATEGIIKVTSLFNHNLHEISEKSLEIVEALLSNIIPQKKVVKSVLSVFPSLAGSQNPKTVKVSLNILAYLMKSSTTLIKMSKRTDVIQSFKNFFESEDQNNLINSLKLIFAFLYKSESLHHNCNYTLIMNLLFPLLEKRNDDVSNLVAACLTLIFQKQPFSTTISNTNKDNPNTTNIESNASIDEELIQNQCNILDSFLKATLSKSDVSVHILNLCGVISTSFDGAMLFDVIEIVPLILNCALKTPNLNTNNNDLNKLLQVRKLVSMVLASLSSINPICSHLIEAFPLILEMMENKENSPYPAIFTANMAIITPGAVLCAENIEIIINNFRYDFPRSLKTIERTVQDQEARNTLERNEKLCSLISALTGQVKERQEKEGKEILNILNEISSIESGKRALFEAGILPILRKRLSEIALFDDSRPTLIRIIGRMQK
ncbi:TKL family protein kinase [Tritrichomonas foetus]|uniref:TKL family protein kinase n=1 Tax=Tritrichomonas foetus TaxID=1144522 RepID=A0A1J4JZN2_9EUKA|nr:TKL family protein kinase [Tritrichomonas foetus]|eukprot:OHT04631.1 TKL family protein kinase [Tritrichomonas foetus]